MKVVIAISGSIIAPKEPNPKDIERVAKALVSLLKKSHKVMVTVGGGPLARHYINVARKLGASETHCDILGITVSRLNARLLAAALKENTHPEPPTHYGEALEIVGSGRIVVMGGVSPGLSTDAVAATLAEYSGADLFVILTPVGGVYTRDPNKHPSAKKLENIRINKLVDMAFKHDDRRAGTCYIVDSLATRILQRARIPGIVIGMSDINNLERVIEKGEHTGTNILPEK